jgi:hypothetical protein
VGAGRRVTGPSKNCAKYCAKRRRPSGTSGRRVSTGRRRHPRRTRGPFSTPGVVEGTCGSNIEICGRPASHRDTGFFSPGGAFDERRHLGPVLTSSCQPGRPRPLGRGGPHPLALEPRYGRHSAPSASLSVPAGPVRRRLSARAPPTPVVSAQAAASFRRHSRPGSRSRTGSYATRPRACQHQLAGSWRAQSRGDGWSRLPCERG